MTEADDVAALLIRIFESNDKTMSLFHSCLALEIARTGLSLVKLLLT